MTTMLRSTLAMLALTACLGLAGCGDDGGGPSGTASDGGMCGTLASPGILQVKDLVPSLGATLPNQAIVHSFTVANAPAIYTNFGLDYGSSHTAGGPRPAHPSFQVTRKDADLLYRLTLDSWSYAPAHVEILVPSGFTTPKGCWWQFPSPLFSYDIAAVAVDGGVSLKMDSAAATAPAAPEGGAPEGGSGGAHDGALGELAPEDAPSPDAAMDAPLGDAPLDEGMGVLDTALDSEAPSLDGWGG